MAATDATVDMTIVMFHGIVQVIAALGGLLCIYLGWRLYHQGVASPVKGEAALGDSKWRFRLASAGPGAFLALFGAGLLAWLAYQKVGFEDTTVVPQPAGAVANNTSAPRDAAPVLLTPAQYQRPPQVNAQQYVCVLVIRKRVFLNGQGLTPERISADLGTARSYLAEDARRASDPRATSQLNDAVDTIDQLRQSVGVWPLAQ